MFADCPSFGRWQRILAVVKAQFFYSACMHWCMVIDHLRCADNSHLRSLIWIIWMLEANKKGRKMQMQMQRSPTFFFVFGCTRSSRWSSLFLNPSIIMFSSGAVGIIKTASVYASDTNEIGAGDHPHPSWWWWWWWYWTTLARRW